MYTLYTHTVHTYSQCTHTIHTLYTHIHTKHTLYTHIVLYTYYYTTYILIKITNNIMSVWTEIPLTNSVKLDTISPTACAHTTILRNIC